MISWWWLGLFPLLFAVHDLEEALRLPQWLEKEAPSIRRRFPRLAAALLPRLEALRPRDFRIMALEELVLILLVTVGVCRVDALFYLWLALFLAFVVHLALHLVQGAVLRRWIPAVRSALFELPLCGWILCDATASMQMSWRGTVTCLAGGSLFALVNWWMMFRIVCARRESGSGRP